MHEMAIAKGILKIVNAEMKKAGRKRLKSLKVRVGEVLAVDHRSLIFAFDACVKDTPLEGAKLDIEDAPITGVCSGCKKEFVAELFPNACPECGVSQIEYTRGDELDVVSMETF